MKTTILTTILCFFFVCMPVMASVPDPEKHITNDHTVPEHTDILGELFPPETHAGSVYVRPITLREEDDSLKLELEIRICSEAMNRRQTWSIVPELYNKEDDRSHIFPVVAINGKVKELHYKRQNRYGNTGKLDDATYRRIQVAMGRDTVIKYTASVPYMLWMDNSSLRLRQVLTSSAGKTQLFTSEDSGGVVLLPHEPYMVDPRVNFVTPEKESKFRKIQGQAYLDFQVGRSVIIPTFRRNPEELAKISEVVQKVSNDPDVEITSIFIEGYASPEGSYALNDRLSRERALALKDFLRITFGLDEKLFRVSSVAEDWDGLRTLIAESTIPQKENIYRIIDSDSDFDWKEQRLKFLGGGPWRTMSSEIFPRLRRVEYQIDFSVKDYSIEETRDLAGRNPELLSQRELFMLAQTYPAGTTQRDEVFDLIFRLYPDETAAVINSAAVLIQRGEYKTAGRYLERAVDDPKAFNNLGVLYLMQDDLDRAEEYFIRAGAGNLPEAYHNLEEVKRKREDNKLMERYKR